MLRSWFRLYFVLWAYLGVTTAVVVSNFTVGDHKKSPFLNIYSFGAMLDVLWHISDFELPRLVVWDARYGDQTWKYPFACPIPCTVAHLHTLKALLLRIIWNGLGSYVLHHGTEPEWGFLSVPSSLICITTFFSKPSCSQWVQTHSSF